MELRYFTKDEAFPFSIHYGVHDEEMPYHRHRDFCELVIVLDGSAQHIVSDCLYHIKKGDVFVLGDGIYHGYKEVDKLRICNIMFRPENLLSADYDIKKYSGFHSLFMLTPSISNTIVFKNRMTLSSDSYLKLKNMISLAIDEYENNRPGRYTIISSYFMQIVVELSRAYTLYSEENGSIQDGIAKAAAFMETNYSRDIKSEELFSISHYSERHFNRLFQSIYRISPQKYLINIRIRQACILLRETGLSITEIAIRCGFSSSNYFARLFKKYMNMSPNEYRSVF